MAWFGNLLSSNNDDFTKAVAEDLATLRVKLGDEQYQNLKQEEHIEALQAQVDELKLVVAGLTRLLTTKGQCTAAELQALIDAIDASDGKADGKLKGPIIEGGASDA